MSVQDAIEWVSLNQVGNTTKVICSLVTADRRVFSGLGDSEDVNANAAIARAAAEKELAAHLSRS